ncbi:XdhC family protein [Flavitalea flava]
MKELRSITSAYLSIDLAQTRAALATVVRVEGSSYRRMGARMLVLDNGTYLGGISGGCLEGDALRRAQKAIALGYPSVITYDTMQEDDHQVGVGLGCQGVIDVLFSPLDKDDKDNPLLLLTGLTDIREPAVVLTLARTEGTGGTLGQTFLFGSEKSFLSTFPIPAIRSNVLQDINNCLADRGSRSLSYALDEGQVQVLIEVVLPATQVVIYGGGYDIPPLLNMAKELGWETTVVTNLAKADKTLWSGATRVLSHTGEEKPEIDLFTAILLMTHDYKADLRHLLASLPTVASYIGILGARKRTEKMWDALALAGTPLSDKDRQRIYSPAGLDIGACTPEEIALSILGEIRSHFSGRQGMPLRLRKGAIYDN